MAPDAVAEPTGVVTTTSALPGVPAGTVHTRDVVPVTTTPVAATPRIVTLVAPFANAVPVMVIDAPPEPQPWQAAPG